MRCKLLQIERDQTHLLFIELSKFIFEFTRFDTIFRFSSIHFVVKQIVVECYKLRISHYLVNVIVWGATQSTAQNAGAELPDDEAG